MNSNFQMDGTQLAAICNSDECDVIVWSYPFIGEILFQMNLPKWMDTIEWNPFRPNVFAIFNRGLVSFSLSAAFPTIFGFFSLVFSVWRKKSFSLKFFARRSSKKISLLHNRTRESDRECQMDRRESTRSQLKK